jgi:tripartite-type tricarboxylate transporter receptor subunit TctC
MPFSKFMHSHTRAAITLATAALLTAGVLPAADVTYPQRAVTIIVPSSPGTGHDILARTLGRKLSDRWGTGVVIDNKSGASGAIGAELTARAAPDGHTVMMVGATFAMYAALNKNARYDPVRGFQAVNLAATTPLVFAVSGAMPTKTLRSFTALAKAQPGGIHYASPGNGTPQHLAMELFKLNAGVNLLHVPYKSTAAATQELAGGHISAMILPAHTAAPLASAGKLRVLATLGDARSRVFTDAPTLGEAGVPNVDTYVWYGLMAPAATPRDIVRKLNDEINTMLKLPEVADALSKQGLTVVGGEPEKMADLVKSEMERWTRVIIAAKIKAD